MPFGEDLLDKQDEIEDFGAEGNAAIARLCEYLKRRAQAAEDYARSLGKIAKQFSPAGPHELGLADLLGSVDHTMQAYNAIAHDVTSKLIDSLRETAKEHSSERAAVLSDVARLRADYAKMCKQIERLKDKRSAAILDAEEAKHAFLRVNYDRNASRAHVERLREEKERRAGKALYAKQEFIDGSRTFARIREQFYGHDLPMVFGRLQEVEETRIARVKGVLCDFCSLYSNALSDELAYLRAFVVHWEQTLPSSIVEVFVESVRSDGVFEFPEGDIIAIDDDEEGDSTKTDVVSPQRSGIVIDPRGPAGSAKPNRKVVLQQLAELLQSNDPLPLRARLAEIAREEQMLVKEQDALMRLSGINAAAPDLSDHDTNAEVVRQMNEIRRDLDDLRSDRSKLLGRLSNVEHSGPVDDASVSEASRHDDAMSVRTSCSRPAEIDLMQGDDFGASFSSVRSKQPVLRSKGTGRRVNRASANAFACIVALDPINTAAMSDVACSDNALSCDAGNEQQRDTAVRSRQCSQSGAPDQLAPQQGAWDHGNGASSHAYAGDAYGGAHPSKAAAGGDAGAPQMQSRPHGAFKAQVMYDFDATGRTAGELSVHAGDIVTIHTFSDEWWQAENDAGTVGYVPHNYVCKLPDGLGMC